MLFCEIKAFAASETYSDAESGQPQTQAARIFVSVLIVPMCVLNFSYREGKPKQGSSSAMGPLFLRSFFALSPLMVRSSFAQSPLHFRHMAFFVLCVFGP